MSFEQLKKKAKQLMQQCNTTSQYAAFLLGLICQQTNDDSNIEYIINISNKLEQLIDSKLLAEGTQEQVLFTLYQNLNKKQSFDFQNEQRIITPVLSENGSPQQQPLQHLINNYPQSSTKMETEQPKKIEDQGNSMYWYKPEESQTKVEINPFEYSDQETMDLIKRIQEEDRDEQLKLKTMQKKQDDDMECPICCDTLIGGDACPLEGCSHVYHKACLSDYIAQAMKERRMNINCPDANCKSNLNEIDIRVICGEHKQIEFSKYTLDQFIDTHADLMSWCPTPGCGFAFVIGDDAEDSEFTCPLCKLRYCLNCRVLFHQGQTCKEYQVTNTRDENDVKFEKFVKGKKYKTCTKCRFWVEKNKGCNHMTCRCGYQFCYKCGGIYPTCQCVIAAQQKQLKQQELLVQTLLVQTKANPKGKKKQ